MAFTAGILVLGILVGTSSSATELRFVREKVRDDVQSLQSACDVVVSFGSAMLGQDSESTDKIHAFIKASTEIDEAVSRPFGKEGERFICLKTASMAVATRIQKKIDELISERTRMKGVITVRMVNP